MKKIKLLYLMMMASASLLFNSCNVAPNADSVQPKAPSEKTPLADNGILHFESREKANEFMALVKKSLTDKNPSDARLLQNLYQGALSSSDKKDLEAYTANSASNPTPIEPGDYDPYDPGTGDTPGGGSTGSGGFSVGIIPYINGLYVGMTWDGSRSLTGLQTTITGFHPGMSATNTYSQGPLSPTGGINFQMTITITYSAGIGDASLDFTQVLEADVYYDPSTDNYVVLWH